MATGTFSTTNDPDFGSVINVGGTGSSSSDRLIVKQGAVVYFSHTFHNGDGTPDVNIGTNTSIWSSPSTITVPYLGSANKTLSLTAPLGDNTISLSLSGYIGDTLYIFIESNIDTDPGPITIADVTFALKLNYYETKNILLSGITDPIAVGGSSGVTWSKNGAAFTSAATTVVAGNFITFKQQSSSAWGATVTRTLTLGDWSDSWSITNQPDPGSGEILLFNKTAAPLTGSDLTSFYGGNKKLSEFLKSPSGALIPDIIQNSSVPTAVTLKFSQLVGSGTVLYFDRPPANLNGRRDTAANGAGTITVQWLKDSFGEGGWDVGFGQVSNAVLIKYTLIPDAGQTATAYMNANNTTDYSLTNTWVTVNVDVSNNEEAQILGKVLIQVKHKDFQSQVISIYANYFLNAYGN